MDPSPSDSGTPPSSGEREAKAAESIRFPCPSCGAGLRYDPRHRGLSCPFCGTARSIDGADSPVAEQDLAAVLKLAGEAHDASRAAARRVDCQSCGASVEIAPTEKAGRCAYCGSSRVVEDEPDRTRIAPLCLIPFALDGDAARDLFARWMRSLWFRPNALKSRSSVAEMRGVLVPFWTFDAGADSSWTAEAGYYYYVTVGSGKNRRRVRQVRWVPASGERHDAYDDVLVCASKGLDSGLCRKIEPFQLRSLVPYRDEYLAGWAAESYALDVKEGWAIAREIIRDNQQARCAGDVPGDTQRALEVATIIAGRSYKHVLLPVWVAAYRFRETVYRFLINGQTGEVHGQAPLSWVKILLAVLAALAVIGAIALIAQA